MDYGRIWRIARTPVILVSLLLLVIIAGRWGYASMIAPVPPPQVAPCVEQPVPEGQLKSEMISVKVFNASKKRGKASEVKQQLQRQGFKVIRVANAESKQEKSVIIGAAADAPEVRLVAQQFKGFETSGDDRPDRSVEVRIGLNYDSMVGDAPTSMEIGATSICLPIPPTAAPA